MSDAQQDAEVLHELLQIMHDHDLDRLKASSGGAVFELVRREPGMPMGAPPATPPSAALSAPDAHAGSTVPPPSNVKRVLAPLTGVFYRSASPDSEAFVTDGSRIAEGDVLCILEAMKLFNEIQSDYSGTVLRILPNNGELVTQGEELFWIAP